MAAELQVIFSVDYLRIMESHFALPFFYTAKSHQ